MIFAKEKKKVKSTSKKKKKEKKMARYWNKEQKVPYIVHGDQWYGYDDESSLAWKVSALHSSWRPVVRLRRRIQLSVEGKCLT